MLINPHFFVLTAMIKHPRTNSTYSRHRTHRAPTLIGMLTLFVHERPGALSFGNGMRLITEIGHGGRETDIPPRRRFSCFGPAGGAGRRALFGGTKAQGGRGRLGLGGGEGMWMSWLVIGVMCIV